MKAPPPAAGEALPAVLIEAFTRHPCAGNGAAVVLLERARPGGWMRAVAGSLRQSETAFLLRAGGEWLLRWFTPACEVALCGHATLAALLALGHWGSSGEGGSVRFRTRSGLLTGLRDRRDPWRGSIHLPGGDLRPLEPPQALDRLVQARLGCPIEGFWTSALGYRVSLLPAGADLERMASLASELVGEERRGLVLMQPWPEGHEPPRPGAAPPRTTGCPSSHRRSVSTRIPSPAPPTPWWPPTGWSGRAGVGWRAGNAPTVRGGWSARRFRPP